MTGISASPEKKKKYLVNGIYSGIECELKQMKSAYKRSRLKQRDVPKLTSSKKTFLGHPIQQWEDKTPMCHDLQHLEALEKRFLIDLIEDCHLNVLKEVDTICKWANFFKNKNIAFVVVNRNGELVLFKEKKEDGK